MRSLFIGAVTLWTIVFLTSFSYAALGDSATGPVRTNTPSPLGGASVPDAKPKPKPAEDEVQKKRRECDSNFQTAQKTCDQQKKGTVPAGKLKLNCVNGKIPDKERLTTSTAKVEDKAKDKNAPVECVTQASEQKLLNKGKNCNCATGSTTTRLITEAHMKEAKISCYGSSASGVTICNEDQKKLSEELKKRLGVDDRIVVAGLEDKTKASDASPGAVEKPKPALATTTDPKPKPDAPALATTTDPKPKPAAPALATTTDSKPKPAAPSLTTTTVPKPAAPALGSTADPRPAPFVASNQQGPAAQTPSAPAAQVAPVQQPYQTGNQQQRPTGVQTGRQQRDTQAPQRDYSSAPRVAQSTPQRESWLSSWLSPRQESQAPQQAPVVINNNNAQPWFIAEMKRMEDARLKAELEKKQLADTLKREAEAKQKAEKEKKLAKNTPATKLSKTQKDAEEEVSDIDPQTTFLKALMDAPSLEEVAKQYEEEQQKENEAYAKEQTKTTTIVQRPAVQPSVEDRETKVAVEQKIEQRARTTQQTQRRVQPTYSDIVPFTQETQNIKDENNAPQKSSLVSMLDQEAIKKGIPAPRIQEIPLPEKIAFTRTSYTVVVPTIRQTIKTIMRAYEKGELSQLERDRHATQLVALSEQLAGSAYGADFDTTQVLNDAARATELTAFMIAEHADNKAISDSLYGVFATLTPLTKSEPVALTPPSGSLKEWSEQHFALIKYKIETAMEDTQSQKAKELYSKALSLVKSAELYKDSDQQYWNSSADIKEAVRTLSLATALDRASKEPAALEDAQTQEQKSVAEKAKTREALLKDKGQEKGIWGSFLNMLGL